MTRVARPFLLIALLAGGCSAPAPRPTPTPTPVPTPAPALAFTCLANPNTLAPATPIGVSIVTALPDPVPRLQVKILSTTPGSAVIEPTDWVDHVVQLVGTGAVAGTVGSYTAPVNFTFPDGHVEGCLIDYVVAGSNYALP